MRLDFKNIFDVIGRKIVSELKTLMLQSKHIDGGHYAQLAESTKKQKARLPIPTENIDRRMLRTQDFVNNAFKYESLPNGIKVFISNTLHGRELKSMHKTLGKYKVGGNTAKIRKQAMKIGLKSVKTPTYRKIAEWQIPTGNSTFFPQSMSDVDKMPSVIYGREYFYQQAYKQIKEQAKLNLKTVISLG